MNIFIKAIELYFCSLLVTLPLIGLISGAQATIRWVRSRDFKLLEAEYKPDDTCLETPLI